MSNIPSRASRNSNIQCPGCQSGTTSVVDSRTHGDHRWRRRLCFRCQRKFTTLERARTDSLDAQWRAANR